MEEIRVSSKGDTRSKRLIFSKAMVASKDTMDLKGPY